MQIGIGLPGMIPGTKGEQIVEWARRADSGPFSSLASLDRLVYRNYESLIVLAAAAAVTAIGSLLVGACQSFVFFRHGLAATDADPSQTGRRDDPLRAEDDRHSHG